MRGMIKAYIIFIENQKGRGHVEDLGIDGRTILGYILGK
jgi:hypothetical protein